MALLRRHGCHLRLCARHPRPERRGFSGPRLRRAGAARLASESGASKICEFLATLMIALLIVNAACGIIEARLHQHLFPYIIDGQQISETYFRATAFNGHPLCNAMLTGIAMLAVTAAPWPMLVRVGLLSVLGMGLFAFGGRAALIVSALGCILIIGRELRQSKSNTPGSLPAKFLSLRWRHRSY